MNVKFHSYPSRAFVKNERGHTSTPLSAFMACTGTVLFYVPLLIFAHFILT